MTVPTGIQPDQTLEQLVDRNQKLGEGTSRVVYAVVGHDDLAIKESNGSLHLENIIEWIVWNAVEKMQTDGLSNSPNHDLVKMFAKTYSISQSGRFLVMERLNRGRADAITANDIFKNSWPDWLNDKKPSAFGRDDAGNIRVLDYAGVDFYRALNPKNKSNESFYS